MGRLIQEKLKKALAEEILFGDLQKGGTVKVDTKVNADGKTVLDLTVVENAPVKPKKEPTPAKPKKRSAAKSKADGKKPGGGAGSVPKVPLPAK